jgi:hypothetical protein
MAKLHYRIVPIKAKTNLQGLYKMDWGGAGPWMMDLHNLIEETVPGGEIFAGAEARLKTGIAHPEAKVFGFEGGFFCFETPKLDGSAGKTAHPIAIIKRSLRKCKQCGCYHSAADICPAITKGGKG